MFQDLRQLGSNRLPVVGESSQKGEVLQVEHGPIAHHRLRTKEIRQSPDQVLAELLDALAPRLFEALLPSTWRGGGCFSHKYLLFQTIADLNRGGRKRCRSHWSSV